VIAPEKPLRSIAIRYARLWHPAQTPGNLPIKALLRLRDAEARR
jgi:hypothetical protein